MQAFCNICSFEPTNSPSFSLLYPSIVDKEVSFNLKIIGHGEFCNQMFMTQKINTYNRSSFDLLSNLTCVILLVF